MMGEILTKKPNVYFDAILGVAGEVVSSCENCINFGRIKSRALVLSALLLLSPLIGACTKPVSTPAYATAEAVIAHYDENVQQFQNSGESERLLAEIIEHNPYIAETSALLNFMPAENGLGGGYCSGGIFEVDGDNFVFTAKHCMTQRITDTLRLSRPHLPDKEDIVAVIEAQSNLPGLDITIMRVNTFGISFPPYVAPTGNVDPRNISTQVTGIVFPGGEVIPAKGHASNLTAEEDDFLNTSLTNPVRLEVPNLTVGASGGIFHGANGDIYMSVEVIDPNSGYEGALLIPVQNLNDSGLLP